VLAIQVAEGCRRTRSEQVLVTRENVFSSTTPSWFINLKGSKGEEKQTRLIVGSCRSLRGQTMYSYTFQKFSKSDYSSSPGDVILMSKNYIKQL
jgi:hypothetical protein